MLRLPVEFMLLLAGGSGLVGVLVSLGAVFTVLYNGSDGWGGAGVDAAAPESESFFFLTDARGTGWGRWSFLWGVEGELGLGAMTGGGALASRTDGETLRGSGLGGAWGGPSVLSIIAMAGELVRECGRGWTGGMTLGLPGTFGGTLIAGMGLWSGAGSGSVTACCKQKEEW